jgi:tetratricopeptide (TPR) repeat protein
METSPWILAGICFQMIPLVLFSVLSHELGHVVCGRLAGYRVTAMGFGIAEPLFVWRIAGLRFYLCRRQPLQALTWVIYPTLLPPRSRTAFLLSGGPLANLLLALASFLLLPVFERSVIALYQLFLFNLYFAIMCLLPFGQNRAMGTLRSDGAQLLALFRSNRVNPVTVPGINLAQRSLWEALGDTEMLRFQLLSSAAAAQAIEDTDSARRWWMEAQNLPGSEGAIPEGMAELVEAEIRQSEGDIDSAEIVRRALAERFLAAGRDAERLLIELGRRDSGAIHRLPTFKDADALNHFPHLRTCYWWGLVQVAARDAPESQDRYLARYEAARQKWRSFPLDLTLYRTVAFHREARGDKAGAMIAYEQAIQAVRAIHAGLAADTVMLEGFVKRMRPLLERAARCFSELGRYEEAERIMADLRPYP